MDFLQFDLFNIFLRTQIIGIPVATGDTSAHQDALEIELFTQFLACLIQSSFQPDFPVFRMDKYIITVKNISPWIMGGEYVVPGDMPAGVVIAIIIIPYNEGKSTVYYFAVGNDADLTFREYLHQLPDMMFLSVCPPVPVSFDHRFFQLMVIARPDASQLDF